jgi:hypothetical protein
MRLLTVILLTGCISDDCYRPDRNAAALAGAMGLVGFIADVAINSQREEPPEEPQEPPPTGIRRTTRGPARPCRDGRSFHRRCVTSVGGTVCFWETDEGDLFDCPDDKCSTIPRELADWCY